MKIIQHATLSLISVLILSACASAPLTHLQVNKSYLTEPAKTTITNAELISQDSPVGVARQQEFRFVPPLKLQTNQAVRAKDVLTQFSDSKTITIAADDLPLADYLHQVLGEQLQVSYILGEEIKSDKKSITLNLQEAITERKLFSLTEKLLTEREYTIRFDEGIFYIHKKSTKSNKGNVVFGYGKKISDVPQTSLNIIQMIPLEYGNNASLPNTLRLLLGVTAIPDNARNSLSIQGKRKDVVRALDLIQLIDQPKLKNRQIGVYKAAFLTTKELITKITEFMAQEGIAVSSGRSTATAITIVELDKQGEIIFFANNTAVIERAVFWAKKIDKPVLTSEKKYYIYQPMYSRAIDMGESLEALIGNGSGVGNRTSAAGQNDKGGSRVRSATSKDMKMVVDERANSLIFYTTGAAYQQLYPMIKRLDVLPKQVMLEVMIAEVTLTDTFKSGVDVMLTNKGSASTVGGFQLDTGAKGLTYALSGAIGKISVDLLQSNDNVNILSRPSLLVRDGVNASINVGNNIPTVGEIISDPTNGNRTSVIYLSTGVDLQVKPTINARGVIIMEINQKISDQAKGNSAVAGSPIIFERSIKTEVIAQNGQTIVLGGLISDKHSLNDTSVPFFSSIPLLGKLFDSKEDATIKTELVVLVTPRIIESSSDWDEIKAKFSASLNELVIE